MSQLFEPQERHDLMATAAMGTRCSNGRYKLPTLPGEEGTKAGGDWVPGGLQSMTNLASSISDTKALGEHLTRQTMIGLGLHPELATELRSRVWFAKTHGEVDFQNLRAHPEFREELDALAERAKDIAGANAARDAGIARHDAWEAYTKTGASQLFSEEIAGLRGLLDAAGFELIPDVCERTVRNLALKAAGRFDNILLHRKTGRLIMADLKTKAKPFWTWLEMDGQLAGYAYSEWMLTPDLIGYEPGPLHHVDLTEGVILHMPSRPDENGSQEPRLRRADLVSGIKTMQIAREVCTQRSYGRSAGRAAESWWPVN